MCVVGCSRVVVLFLWRCWLLRVYQLFVFVFCVLFDVGCRLLVVVSWLFLFVVCCLLFVLSLVCCWLFEFVVCC